jgi:hypothetical protein
MSKLRQLPDGQWAIAAPGREPVAIPVGEVFLIEVGSKMKQTRMERRPSGKFYSVDGYKLRDGMTAGFFDRREHYAKVMP